MFGGPLVGSLVVPLAVTPSVGVPGEPLADLSVVALVARPPVGGPVRSSVVAVGVGPAAVVLAEGASGWAGRWVGEAGEGRGEGAPGEAEFSEGLAELGEALAELGEGLAELGKEKTLTASPPGVRSAPASAPAPSGCSDA
ncbi:hypothetical protein GCM10010295_46850 [Streptomyces intermedius]